ncbi:hypothetical protein MHI57_24845 [Cytobacillus sp. FSL K6-0129]|uniref:hypothetical protein n=1 Tax=Cytobacillus sp. FSL K6-0129 TaxID=2921421 RepID=UPI0030FCD14F
MLNIQKKSIYLQLSFSLLIASLITVLFFWVFPTETLTDFSIILMFTVAFIILSRLLSIPIPLNLFLTSLLLVKSVVLLYLYQSGNAMVFPDSHHYLSVLNSIKSSGDISIANVQSISGTLHVGYYYFAYLIESFTGSIYALLIANTFLISVSLLLFYKVITMDFTRRIALYTTIIGAISMNMFLFGSFILKDALVVFLLTLSLYIYKTKKNGLIFALIISMLLSSVRIYSGVAIIAAIIVDKLINKKNKIKKRSKIIFLTLMLIMYFVLTKIPFTNRYITSIQNFYQDYSIVDIILSFPGTFLKFYFSPLPWNLISETSFYTWLIADSALFLLLSIGLALFVLKWFKYKELRNRFWIYLIPIIVHVVPLSLEYGGASDRQRLGVFSILILTLILGIFYKQKKNEEV